MSQRLWLVALVVLAGCGGGSSGGGSPTAPSGSTLSAPTSFRITLQKVNFTSNEIQFAWTGSASTYHITAGTSPGGSDKLSADVAAQNYTWTAPREEALYYVRVVAVNGGTVSSPSIELPVFTMDLRNAIDALFFSSGPMADTPSNAFNDPSAAMWEDGTVLRIVVSQEAGEATRANAQTFADDYAALTGGFVTATTEIVPDDFHTTTLLSVPMFQIDMRVLPNFCGVVNVIACAYYGPVFGRSIVTMNGVGGSVSIAHELGHAFGMSHVHVNSSVRPELQFLMNPTLVATQMTETEKNAIVTARNGGLRNGWKRSQALAAGLVLPYTGGTSRLR